MDLHQQRPYLGMDSNTITKGLKYILLGKRVLAIRRIFYLVDMITNTKFSNCPNVFKIGVARQ